MSRIPFICGNWKMNNLVSDSIALLDGILPRLSEVQGVEVGAASMTSVHAASKRLAGSGLRSRRKMCITKGQAHSPVR